MLPKSEILPTSKYFVGLADDDSGHFYIKIAKPNWIVFYSNLDEAWKDAKEMKKNHDGPISICQVNIETSVVCDALTAVLAGNTIRDLELLCVEFLDVN